MKRTFSQSAHSLNLIFIIWIFLVMGCMCGGNNGNQTNVNNPSTPAVTQTQQCPIKLEQAPEVKGFRLGMTADQIRKQVPQFKDKKPDEFGFTQTYLINGKPDYQVPEGIQVNNIDSMMVRLSLLKGRVISVASYNPPDAGGIKLEEYQARVPESLKIPYKLEKDAESSDYLSLTCDGFKVKSGFELMRFQENWLPTRYWFYSVEETNAAAKLNEQRQQARIDKEQKEKRQQQEKANNFKP